MTMLRLRIRDEVRILTDDLGLPRPSDEPHVLERSRDLLSQIEIQLGPPAQTVERRREEAAGRAFGGLEVFWDLLFYLFTVGSISALRAALPLLREFLQLKLGRRSISIEADGKRIDLKDISEAELERFFQLLREKGIPE